MFASRPTGPIAIRRLHAGDVDVHFDVCAHPPTLLKTTRCLCCWSSQIRPAKIEPPLNSPTEIEAANGRGKSRGREDGSRGRGVGGWGVGVGIILRFRYTAEGVYVLSLIHI